MLWLAASAALSLGLALGGLRKGSLSLTGAAAAVLVGMLHMASGFEFGATLIAFYLTSSKLTKWRSDLKSRLETEHTLGGRRGAAQVLANSLLGAVLAAAAWLHSSGSGGLHGALASGAGGSGGPDPFGGWGLLPGSTHLSSLLLGSSTHLSAALACAFVGFYACCAADTWSSEMGIAARAPPRLITSGRRVPPGTNGALSLLGTSAAAAGGALMGCVFCASAWLAGALAGGSASRDGSSGSIPGMPGQAAAASAASTAAAASACWPQVAANWRLVPLACAAGLAGSLLDSLLGATLQWSGFDERSGKAVSGKPPEALALRDGKPVQASSAKPAAPSGGAGAGAAGGHIKHICGRDVLSNTGVNAVSSAATCLLAAAVGARWLGACAVAGGR